MDVNLPAMGADPNVKDIFVEVDWMDCAVTGSSGCSGPHTTDALDVRAQEALIATFWCAPERIVLHIDAGPGSIMDPTVDSCQTRRASGPMWGGLSEGTAIQHQTAAVANAAIPAHMNTNRIPAFHHAFLQHTSAYYPAYTGYAFSDFFSLGLGTVTFPVGPAKTERHQAETSLFLHELGHQLGLGHGGPAFASANFKPNYLSSMNYLFSSTGLIVNGTVNLTYDYSRWALDTLDESSLDEGAGLGPDGPITAGGRYYATIWDCTGGPTFAPEIALIAFQNIDWDCDGSEDGFGTGSCSDIVDNGGDVLFDQFDADCLAGIEPSVSVNINHNGGDSILYAPNDWANLDFGWSYVGPAGEGAGEDDNHAWFDSIDGSFPGDDTDGDGLLDAAEPENGTSGSDPDSDDDGVEDGDEVGVYLTDPMTGDSDGDGCPDGRELGTNQVTGGLRYPLNSWDYFNPSHDGLNRVDDILLVVGQYFKDTGNPAYNPDYDRTLLGPNAWNLGPGNGLQRVDDILNSVNQYFHDCA